MTLYLLNYNNYYNRILRKGLTINEYLPFAIGSPIYRVNFNPNDYVMTEQVINWPTYNDHPDYLIVVDDYNNILHRWFVIEATRTRAGQYRLILKRDVLADFKDEILTAPVFIEKATLPISNNLIFNRESMTYNQVLDRKISLRDDTSVPWVVGYIPRDSFSTAKNINITSYVDANSTATFETNGLANWSYYRYTTQTFYPNDEITLNVNMGWDGRTYDSYNIQAACKPGLVEPILSYIYPSDVIYEIHTPTVVGTSQLTDILNSDKVREWVRTTFANFTSRLGWDMDISPAITSAAPGIATRESSRYFKNLNGKTIKDTTTGYVYNIELVPELSRLEGQIPINSNSGIVLKDRFTNQIINPTTGTQYPSTSYWSSRTFLDTTFGYLVNGYTIKLTQRATQAEVKINTTRYHLEDAPYDMFCIPAKDIDIYKNGVFQCTAQGSLAMAVATAIGAETGSANVYDIQLLPYCPVRYMIEGPDIDIKEHPVHIVEDEDNQPLTYILWATSSTDKFNIYESISVPTNNIEFKIASETEFFRIVSPNGNGMYEFTPAKNDGVEYFEVDFTYKPFSPYIHVKPAFRRLNGDNPDKDFRGLICGGDFSITQLSNDWANYQLRNVNYQNIFARQIENMNVNNSVQRSREVAGAIFGTAGAGLTSGLSLAQTGNPYIAAAGATVGAGASAVGGVLDITMADKLRSEALDYTRDMFGYNLGNIQAIPTSISKTGAQVYTNTLFPMLEYYRATQEEIDALRNKLKYNGMSVGVIDYINRYLWSEPTYIKGKLVRLEGISDDYHIINAIAEELNKGVFI